MRCGMNGDGRRSGRERVHSNSRLGRMWEISSLTTFMCEHKGNVKNK